MEVEGVEFRVNQEVGASGDGDVSAEGFGKSPCDCVSWGAEFPRDLPVEARRAGLGTFAMDFLPCAK